MNPVIEQLASHRSIRRYTDQPVDEALLHDLLRAGQGAATSSFIQAYSIVQVTDPSVRDAIAHVAHNQRWVREAPVFLLMCADLNRVARAVRKSLDEELAVYTEHFITATVDTALMAQNVMVAAESAGLGAVFIGGIRNDPATVSELVALPDLVYPVFGLCLGWPDQDPEIKPRMPVELVLHQERYRAEGIAEAVDRYDDLMRDYYAQRSENRRDSDWSAPTAEAVQRKTRPHMLDFLRGRGFLRR